MTSVIIWQDRELDTLNFDKPHVWERDLWIAADSRISAPPPQHRSGRRVLTDVAPKILPIRFEFFERAEQGPGVHRRYYGELGLAYAGNTLPATMTYATVVSSFAKMTGDCDAELPSLEDMVRFIARVGDSYAREVMAPFELFVTGTCPNDPHGGPRAYHLSLWFDGRPPGYHRLVFDADRRMYVMGNRKEELRTRCRAGFAADIGYNPTAALAEIIDESAIDEVGGVLALARIDSAGGITLFPNYGVASARGRLPETFDGARFGTVGAFEIGLHRA